MRIKQVGTPNILEELVERILLTLWVDKSWLKRPKMVNFDEFTKTWNFRSNSVTRWVNLIGQKKGWKNSNEKILGDFLKMCEAKLNRNTNFWPQVFSRGTYSYVKDELVKLEQVSIETFLWTSRAPLVESIGQPPGFIVNFFLLCPFADMTWCMGFQKKNCNSGHCPRG